MTTVDRPDNGRDEGREVVHACPEDTSGVTDCCGRTPFELNRWSRMTIDPARVTCGRAGAGEQQREQVARWLFTKVTRRDGLAKLQWEHLERQQAHGWRSWADELLALLGGPQPDGEAHQHRMDADCWCQPVQHPSGAWDHR